MYINNRTTSTYVASSLNFDLEVKTLSCLCGFYLVFTGIFFLFIRLSYKEIDKRLMFSDPFELAFVVLWR